MPQSKAEKSIYAAIVRSARSSSCTTTTDPNRSSLIVPLRPVFALCQRDCPPRQRLQPSEAIFAEPALEAKPLFYAPDDTGHVYLLNLRTAAIRHIDLCDPIFKRKEHDITVIKRATWDTLRGGTPKGHPVILVRDRAVIDYRFLQKAKDQAGLYFITRPKSNS